MLNTNRLLHLALVVPLLLCSVPAGAKYQAAVEGCITDAASNPIPNLRVVAWDKDGIVDALHPLDWDYTCSGQDRDDWMGEDLTDSSGCYHIGYDQPNRSCLQSVFDDCPTTGCPGHWDSSTAHGDTNWRPDIYLQVWVPSDGVCEPVPLDAPRHAWRPSSYTPVHWNQPTNTDLTFSFRLGEYLDTTCGTFSPLQEYLENRLSGLVDLHAHPVSHLAFGGKVVHGAPDIGSRTLSGSISCDLNVKEAWRIEDALPDCGPTHGLWIPIDRECGDDLRFGVIRIMEAANNAPDRHGAGYPYFAGWPAHDDVTHQKMWVDWVRRAHRGGLRVMVGLAVHNRTLAELVYGTGNLDDKSVGNAQIEELKRLVSRHSFMEIASDPHELEQIIADDKLAVVLGVELDDMGNFISQSQVTEAQVRAEIRRLFDQGVRYVLPIHLVDNEFGGTAVYKEFFALANRLHTGNWWELDCGPTTFTLDNIHEVNDVIAKVGELIPRDLVDEYIPGFSALFDEPIQPSPSCPGPGDPSSYGGYVNSRGLSDLGIVAIQEMMRLGMMIDIDHMSDKTVDQVIQMADSTGYGYPLNSGHSSRRGDGGEWTEQGRTHEQYEAISDLRGMAGVGWAIGDSSDFLTSFNRVADSMAGQNLALGTDANGMEKLPQPRPGADVDYGQLPIARTGLRQWNYNSEGVAHYGLMPDFLVDLKSQPGGHALLQQLYSGAAAFYNMWIWTWTSRTFRCPDIDGNPCTEDVATYDLQCFVRTARPGTPCGGGFVCDEQGECGQPPECPQSRYPCETVDWNPTTGQCEQGYSPRGTACGNGGSCDGQGQCDEACPRDSRTECLLLEWSPATGRCELTGALPAGTPCNSSSGYVCDGQGECRPYECPQSQYRCETVDWNPTTGQCEQGYAPEGTACGDGGICDGGGQCEEACPRDSQDECLAVERNPATGRCELLRTLAEGTPCGSSSGYACDGQGECRFVPEPTQVLLYTCALATLALLRRRAS
jgi:hypothetical protein